MRASAILAAAGAALALAAPASAHVEARAGRPAGTVLISVPNESTTAATVSVAVRMPRNAVQVAPRPIDGWRITTHLVPLDPPLAVAGVTTTQRVDTVTWAGRLAPGGRVSFALRIAVARGTPRTGLAFPAVQRYSDGTVVRWIGGPGSEEEAAVLPTAVPAVDVEPVATTTPTLPEATPGTATTAAPTATTGAGAASDGGGGSTGIVIGALAAALAAAGTGAFFLLRRRG